MQTDTTGKTKSKLTKSKHNQLIIHSVIGHN